MEDTFSLFGEKRGTQVDRRSCMNFTASNSNAADASPEMTPPDLSIIIVNWNSAAFVRNCVASIYRTTTGLKFEIVVVDGASNDGCGEMLSREYPAVRFVPCAENVGFARGNNVGVRNARGSTLLFLNPDTEIVGKAVNMLFDELKSLARAGAVGCKLLNHDGSLQTSCIQAFPTVLNQALDFDFLRNRFPRWRLWGTDAFATNGPAPAEVQVLSGACIMMKRHVFEEVGGFAERYFMYAEDADLCFKVFSAGYKIFYLSEANIVHHGGGSSQKSFGKFSSVMMRESIYRFFREQRGLSAALLYRSVMAGCAVARLAALTASLPFSKFPAFRPRKNPMLKWWSIFRWTIGLEGWAARYR
jgi:GT2 family glycosyltransferase